LGRGNQIGGGGRDRCTFCNKPETGNRSPEETQEWLDKGKSEKGDAKIKRGWCRIDKVIVHASTTTKDNLEGEKRIGGARPRKTRRSRGGKRRTLGPVEKQFGLSLDENPKKKNSRTE